MVSNKSFTTVDSVIQGHFKKYSNIRNNVLATLKILDNSTRTHNFLLSLVIRVSVDFIESREQGLKVQCEWKKFYSCVIYLSYRSA